MAVRCRRALAELLLVMRDLLHTCVGAHLHHCLHQRQQKRSNEPCSVGERLSIALLFSVWDVHLHSSVYFTFRA